MVGEARIMVANDPGPLEPAGEVGQARAGRLGQALAPELVVEAVAEAKEAPGAGALELAAERSQRRVRIVGRKELASLGEPARFFEMQVGDQQRLLARPEEGAVSGREECFACERKGNHAAGVTPAHASIQPVTRSRRPRAWDAAARRR